MRLWMVLLVTVVLGAGLHAAFAAMPAVGSAAPDFTLPSQDGTQVSLKDFRGKWVVLYFYPKDGTPGCTIEAHNFQRDQTQYASTMNYKGVEIAARNTFIIDPQGTIQRAYTGVDPNKHSQEVLTALDELQKGASGSK